LPDTAFQLIVSKWEKGAGPKYEEKFAIRVIKDVGFFPLCWDLDKDLYPLLRKQNDPKEKKMVEELVNNLKIELAKKYTILPPEEEPKEGETEAEKQARETREKKRYCFSKTRRDPKEGVGSLIDAATDGRELAIQGLLNAGVRVNAADSEGQTPLFFAAFNGHEACVARLLDAPGVQVNAASNDGLTPLYCAADNGHEACIARLLDAPGVQVNAADSDGWTPLHCAAGEGHEACVARLLDAPGVQVNAANKDGWTPLHLAAHNGNEACVARLLKDPGVQVNAADNIGWTPLYCAADNGHEACIARLLDAPGVQVNAADSDGWTPLHLAAHNGHEACVARLLKDPGVQVNAADNNGWTPLHWATKPIIKQMLEEAEKAEKRKKASSSSSGGKPKTKPKVSKDYVTYTGKKYVVRVGSKGGKYILVGAEKKKVYVK